VLPALDVRHLAKSYHAGVAGCFASVRVLADVTLRVRAGEIVGVCGAGGAGKTTLLLCAAAAVRPDRGEVRWFGVPARADLRRELGVAFVAEFPGQQASLTARQSLEHAAACGAPAVASGDVAGLLDRVGLGRLGGRRVTTLSRGALVRLAVARALLERPRLLLLDGLLDGLDVRSRSSLALLLRTIAADDGVACVVGARDYVTLRGATDRIVTLADGHAAASRSAVGLGAGGEPWRVASRVAERAETGAWRRGARAPARRSVDSPPRAP
jgi:ABC-type multidrug transport system ATPase subunit